MNFVVSVVMPSFNSAKHIVEAMQSVRMQSFQQFELLVVDGGSLDNSVELVQKMSAIDSRIRFIDNCNDQGPAHARCVGIRQAKGRYIAFLDADDLWLPEKIESQVKFMEQTAAQFCYTKYRSVSEDGMEVGCLVPMRRSFSYRQALRHRGIGTLTVMVDRKLLTDDVINVWRRMGGEEYLWWLLILRKGVSARLVNSDLARYRNTMGSLSKNQFVTLGSVWDMYRSVLGMSRMHTAWHYSSYFLDSGIRKLRLGICSAITKRISKGHS